MEIKYKNKYRIPSTRLQSWDYGSTGAYFITICTKNREHYFGEIKNGIMYLNDAGKLTEQEWLKTPQLRPDMNLELGQFVVMPNHFHGIIIIGDNQYNMKQNENELQQNVIVENGLQQNVTVETDCNPSLRNNPSTNSFGPQSKNISSIIRGFKSTVTKQIRICLNPNFEWQSRFHDHIIRDKKSFHTIQNYISNNSINWTEDNFYKNN